MSSKCVPIYPHPILFVETSDNKKFLTISDVHIGCEDRVNQAGVFENNRRLQPRHKAEKQSAPGCERK